MIDISNNISKAQLIYVDKEVEKPFGVAKRLYPDFTQYLPASIFRMIVDFIMGGKFQPLARQIVREQDAERDEMYHLIVGLKEEGSEHTPDYRRERNIFEKALKGEFDQEIKEEALHSFARITKNELEEKE